MSSASTDTVDNGLPTQSAQPTVAGYTRTSHYSVTRVTTGMVTGNLPTTEASDNLQGKIKIEVLRLDFFCLSSTSCA